MQACGCVYGVVLLPSYGVERGVRQGKRPRGKGAVPCRTLQRRYVPRAERWRINNSYLQPCTPKNAGRKTNTKISNDDPGQRGTTCAMGGRHMVQHSRQHRHGAVGHRADQVDREALVEPAPALKVDYLPRGADDARSFAWCAWGEQEPALRLQARPHHFVRVCSHRGDHLCDRRAKKNGIGRYMLIGAVPFCACVWSGDLKRKCLMWGICLV